jgi:N-acetylmuramoyl-L-alanine amidase
MKLFLKIFIAIIILGSGIYFFNYYKLGSVFQATATVVNYNSRDPWDKVRILIVPGHEPYYGGTQYKNILERNLVVEIGQDLESFFESNPNYQTFITRDNIDWNKIFSDYFQNNWVNIIAWEKSYKVNAPNLAALGTKIIPTVYHNSVRDDVALRLYGITKWSNENNIDLMVHLHLNDYPNHSSNYPGEYSGLVIYIPATGSTNNLRTRAIANAVFKRLSLYNPVSNLPQESIGIVDDPQLIAVGVNNTSDAASMLIEYDYIYEPQFVNPAVRDLALKDLAYQTYLGLEDYFNKNSLIATSTYNPSSIYTWSKQVTSKYSDPKDIYAMQAALIMDRDYPPVGKSKNDCPHSGSIGPCTIASLLQFQRKEGITNEDIFGIKTFEALNKIYKNS